MLYLREMEDGKEIKVQEFCRRCGYHGDPLDPSITAEGNIVVYERILGGKMVEPRVNEVLFTDPAVPITNEVRCPNETCPSRTSDTTEPSARYIVLNPDSLQMLYKCVHCDKIWKNSQ
jgi:hypothetical protein